MQIKFYEVFKEEELFLKKFLPSSVKADFTLQTIQASGDKKSADIISIRTQSQIPLDWSVNIKGILTRSQGYDHVIAYLQKTKSSVASGFLGDYCSVAVAEQAVWMMMCLLRKAKQQTRHFETFDRDRLTGLECRDKNALVIGVGKIGGELASLLKGLNMNVKGVDPLQPKKNLEYVTLHQGLRWADIVFSCVPLTRETQGLLNKNIFLNNSKKIYIINVSRGEITPLTDMEELLERGVLSGLALDVFEDEPFLGDALRNSSNLDHHRIMLIKKLCQKDNVIFTPHNAFNTLESIERKAKMSMDSIIHFLEKGKFLWPI